MTSPPASRVRRVAAGTSLALVGGSTHRYVGLLGRVLFPAALVALALPLWRGTRGFHT